ncbi:MAG: hypothetical protein R3321_03050 [Nitrososphaeraceae archaeon]|nr:hypothetical protein [Nitrososphaeraceae archaeon]
MPKKNRSCNKGYPCGLSCINISYICRKSFPEGISISLDVTRKVIQNKIKENKKASTIKENSQKSIENLIRDKIKLDEEKAKEIAAKSIRSTNKDDPSFMEIKPDVDKDYDLSKLKRLGKGAFGAAYETDDIPPRVIKTGNLGEYEVAGLKALGDLGIGPKVYMAEYIGDADTTGFPIRKGNIIMDKVDGTRIHRTTVNDKILKDIILARGKMHQAGFAHRDLHENNMIKTKKGKVQFIDMGLSVKNNTAALLEAFGNHDRLNQTMTFARNAEKVKLNYLRAEQKVARDMEADGIPSKIVRDMRIRHPKLFRKAITRWKEMGWDAEAPENQALIKKHIKNLYDRFENENFD